MTRKNVMRELTGDWEFDFPSYLAGGIDQEAMSFW